MTIKDGHHFQCYDLERNRLVFTCRNSDHILSIKKDKRVCPIYTTQKDVLTEVDARWPGTSGRLLKCNPTASSLQGIKTEDSERNSPCYSLSLRASGYLSWLVSTK